MEPERKIKVPQALAVVLQEAGVSATCTGWLDDCHRSLVAGKQHCSNRQSHMHMSTASYYSQIQDMLMSSLLLQVSPG